MRGHRVVGLSVGFLVAILVAAPGGAQSPSAPASPAIVMPAGTQFDDREPLGEAAASDLLIGYVEHGGVQLQLTSTSRAVGFNYFSTTKARTRASGDRKWKTSTLDDGKRWKAPAGRPSRRGAYPQGVVAGPAGFVATGNQAFWDSVNNYRVAYAGTIWHSTNGRKWSRFDTRAVLGSRSSFQLTSPTVGPDGRYFVAASVGPLDLGGPSKVVVMSSSDGRDWERVSTLDARWTLGAGSIVGTDGGLRLLGREYLCEASSGFQNATTIAPRMHIWESDASGRDWRELDTTAGGLLASAEAVPTRARDCPEDLQERSLRFGIAGTLYSHLPGLLVAVDGELERVGVSRDGLTWNLADLPGAAVEGGRRDPRASMVTKEPDGSVVLLSLEAHRVDGMPRFGAYQVMSWRTTDGGVSWESLAATRPIELNGSAQSLQPLRDGSVMLLDAAYAAGGSTVRRFLATAGPLIPWGSCTPAPGADCRWVTLEDIDVAGQDLSGIDLAHSTVTGGDWTGVMLRDARLVDATIETPLTGSDLTDADATGARLPDLSAVTLDGTALRLVPLTLDQLMGAARTARLAGARVSVPGERPTDLDLSGLDLRDVRFVGGTGPLGDLRAFDFSGLRLDGASFFQIDLTGAKLGKAKFDRLTFYGPDTICPDGKPAKEGVYDQTACRMKAPR